MNPLKWFFLGSNYREEWSLPVKMPVFHLPSTKGGFTIERLGGGEQTKSLHLVGKDGAGWVLRSVDKNVREALPKSIQGTFIQGIVQDQISASYPYAVMTVHGLSSAVGIPSTTAELYYVADDPALGKYREYFAHSVCFLSPKDFDGRDINTENTDSIRHLVDSTSYYRVQQRKVLTVRLLDMLIADWDRHKGQWDWGLTDSAQSVYIFPVPEDRDQAYFLSTGALTKIVRLVGLPHLIGFGENATRLKKLNRKVHSFDEFYLDQLTRKDWEHQIRDFQSRLTDAVIIAAVKELPPEIYRVSGEELKHKLISRRNDMMAEGLKYYDFLARHATVHTSGDPEIINVDNKGDQSTVTITRKRDGREVYRRTFHRAETKSISLAGLQPNDKLHVSGKSSIRLK